MKALVTGSGGLVGSACSLLLCRAGWDVAGIDNNLRAHFFGAQGSVDAVISRLDHQLPNYHHHRLDIRAREAVRALIKRERPDFIIHAAAQPSHDKAASIAYDDFDVNAGGTLNLLVAARDFCPESPFCFMSTNKVYGDRPNSLSLIEHSRRYDYADGRDGIDESMPIDACLHSLFGASKLSADILCQEFGRYFQMPVGIFRAGCITGPDHAAVELHGFLTYLIDCAVKGREYTIYGFKGKQVRDQIHAEDVASLLIEFSKSPHCGEVYNLGGGRGNSASILEVLDLLAEMGFPVQCHYDPANRVGDHICYITDLGKVRSHFPEWKIGHSLQSIVRQILSVRQAAESGSEAAFARNKVEVAL